MNCRGIVMGRLAVDVTQLHIGASIQEEFDRLQIAGFCGFHQRSLLPLISRVDIYSSI